MAICFGGLMIANSCTKVCKAMVACATKGKNRGQFETGVAEPLATDFNYRSVQTAGTSRNKGINTPK